MVFGIGAGQSQSQCQTWINSHGITHPVLSDSSSQIYNLFGNGYVPYNAVMNCEKTVLLTASGFNEAQIRSTIETALNDVISVEHVPQGDIEETGVPIQINATIVAGSPVSAEFPKLKWRANGGLWSTITMINTSDDGYDAEIPGQAADTDVDYFIEIEQDDGCSRTYPLPGEFFTFHVGPDSELPVITHVYSPQIAEIQLPFVISAEVTDNLGVDTVTLEYQINSGGFMTMPMNATDAMYSATITESLVIGDIVEYSITAVDAATVPNSAVDPTSGYYTTEVIDQIPAVIIDLETGLSGPAIRTAIEANLGSAVYTTTMPVTLGIYETAFVCLGVYGAGNHVLSSDEGDALAAFMDAGGRVYMEGGDTWYYDNQTAAHGYFNINSSSDGNSDAGPQVNGGAGSIAEGMTMNYNTGSQYNNYIDRLSPTGGSVTLLNNSSPVYVNAIQYDGGSYKTVGSSILFGGLSDATTTRQAYMDAILAFFGVGQAQPTPTPTPDCINHGDVNLDEELTAGDAQLGFQIALGSYTPSYQEECAADCNADGDVTAGDAQAIFLAVLGSGSCEDPL